LGRAGNSSRLLSERPNNQHSFTFKTMRLNTLAPRPGSKHRIKRLGCGESSGHGKTSGKGHKGQKARAGGTVRHGFEGGQMPLYRRLPKRGFSNAMFAGNFNTVSLGRVQIAVDAGKLDAKAPVTVEALVAARVLRRAKDGVRLLSDGDIKAKLTFEVAHASKAAMEKVEKAGGTVKILAFAAEEKAE
jgi:large subunit ribosomal protein L15